MSKKHGHLIISLLTITMLLLSIYLPSVPIALAPSIPHGDIMWGAGYWPSLTNFNTIKMNDGMGWDTYLMYEPLFGTDVASGQLIRWLGESMEWTKTNVVDDTVYVKLRSGIYWVKISPQNWNRWLNEDPTYKPEYYRPITTADVNYTYYLTGAFPSSPGAAYWMDGLAARVDETVYKGGFEIINDREFKVHIKPEYAHSAIVERMMTRGFLIVPNDIWKQIDPTPADGSYLDFTNDWLAFTGTQEGWRVASGMYLSWYRSVDLTQTILKKNVNWWGISELGREPAPGYMGYLTGIPNDQIIEYVHNGFLDWDGSYIDKIWDHSPELFPYSNTYFADPPYFPDKSTLLLVPNHRKYPLNEPWLHWAIALVMNYPDNSAASSGYCVDGSKYNIYGIQQQYPNAFLIPKDDAIANEYLINYPEAKRNTPYPDGCEIDRNVAQALALLDEYCYQKDGVWYTDDGPSIAWAQNLQNYYGTINVYIGTHMYDSSYLLGNWATIVSENGPVDDDTGHAGVNVALGPWKLMDMEGWTDVDAIDGIVANTVTNDLGITLQTDFVSWGSYDLQSNGNTFDFMDYCMHWGINGDLYERYTQLFSGTYSGMWNHYGSYVNTALMDLIEELDLGGQTAADQIFDIVNEDLPIIPISGHPDWYIYSMLYWQRWPNKEHAFLPASPYGGATQEANVLYLLLSMGQLVTHPGVVEAPTDLTNDHKVNIKDIALAAKAFGSYCTASYTHPRWEFVGDIMPLKSLTDPYAGDGKVDMKDIGRIARDFGISY